VQLVTGWRARFDTATSVAVSEGGSRIALPCKGKF